MTRPNLLLFMTDQQRADAVGAYGNPVVQTPHLDALAARGTRFAQAFAQHSACSQSRISMMTGWYPHVAGHRTLDNLLKSWEPNLLATLRAAGYFVAWAGIRGDTFAPGVTAASTDYFGYVVKPSIDAIGTLHREVFPPDHRLRYAYYVGRLDGEVGLDFDEAAVRSAIALLEEGLPEPFVLYLTLFAPHPPFGVVEPWYSLHDRGDVPAPVPAVTGKARFVTVLRERSGLDRLTDDDWAEIVATYYGMVSRVDDQLGRVLAALDCAGVADRTVTCCFTDHGEYLGDYGLVEKWPSGFDDCLVRNPLVIAGPGVAETHVHEGLVEMIDLFPTLCELAETEAEHVQFGRSLVPVLAGRANVHRDAAFAEGGLRVDEEPQNELLAGYPYDLKTSLLHDEPELAARAIAVRTDAWTYVYRTREADELYDRVQDPDETINVAGEPAHAAVVAELRDRILSWLADTSDVLPLTRDPRMEPALLAQFLASGGDPEP
ncbi:MAG TPA: sulfatase-like hydrolase/transferase [Acidimicrobiia bacterium]|nr:sulfatase-like hydrolase/transferase [Acidimicrobiia bacterium]